MPHWAASAKGAERGGVDEEGREGKERGGDGGEKEERVHSQHNTFALRISMHADKVRREETL